MLLLTFPAFSSRASNLLQLKSVFVRERRRDSAWRDTALRIVSFPSTGGMAVSRHTLGSARHHGTPPP